MLFGLKVDKDIMGPYVIPEDHYLLLGDNRDPIQGFKILA